MDINTTRRSDHTSKYKVLWGPWVSYKKSPSPKPGKGPHQFINTVGVASAQGLPAKAALQIASINEGVLPLKTSSGSSLVTAEAVSGRYYLDAKVGAVLFQSLAPQTALLSSANDWARTLRAGALSTPSHLTLAPSRLPAATMMSWAAL